MALMGPGHFDPLNQLEPNFYCYVPPNTVGASSCRRACPGMCRVTSSEKLGTLYEAGTGQTGVGREAKERRARSAKALVLVPLFPSKDRTGQDRRKKKQGHVMPSHHSAVSCTALLPCICSLSRFPGRHAGTHLHYRLPSVSSFKGRLGGH